MATRAKWRTEEQDSLWGKVKAAFRNDWEQTRNDFGSDRARDLDQDVDNTVNQMFGEQSPERYRDMPFDEMEPAFRYGHAARAHYGRKHPRWNEELRDELRRDYEGENWERDEPLVRYTYGYTQGLNI